MAAQRLLAGGELPDEAMLSMVREALSDETVRPLTDRVDVAAPETVDYAVSGRWYLRRSDAVLLSGVTSAVAQAVEGWRLWQRSQPGRDINPTRLIAAVQAAGAKRVELDSPAFRALEATQVARETDISLLFGGLEALSAERMPEPAAGRQILRPAPVRTLMRRISPWWGVAAAAVVAVGVFLCAGWLREPYCYIDGRPVYDREVAMQATAYFDAFATLGSSERMVEDLMETL